MFGFLNVHKPPGPTSHDIIARVRRRLRGGGAREVKVGHAGTLDPFASGVLVVCVGPATRLADYVQAQPKRYLADIQLGATSTTDDPEGEIAPTAGARPVEPEAVREVLGRFVGSIRQVPPAHSAVHVDGQRAYKLARAGKPPDLAPRAVTVHAIDLLACEYPRVRVDVRCGSGTYIRALARDVGEALGVGGYCSALTRTEVGPFRIDQARRPEDIDFHRDLLDPLLAVAGMPRITVDAAGAQQLRNGRAVLVPDAPPGPEVALVSEDGRLLAIAAPAGPAHLQPVRVFCAS